MKKAPAILCTATLIIGLLPFSAMAAETPKEIPVGTQQLINAPIRCKGGATLVSSECILSDGTTEKIVYRTVYTCDSNGQILSTESTFAGGMDSAKYNGDCFCDYFAPRPYGQLILSMPNDNKRAIYTYDSDGRLLSAGKSDGVVRYTYDAEGRLKHSSKAFTDKSSTATNTYSNYDNNGNPLSGEGWEWNGTATFVYDKNGWLIHIFRPMTGTSYTRDSYGSVTESRETYKDQTLDTIRCSYTYDSLGNILTQTTSKNGGNKICTTTYTYSYSVSASHSPDVMVSRQNLHVDEMVIPECEKYNIDGANYFKLRDLAKLLSGTASQFSVGYDEATNTVTLAKGDAYIPTGGELEVGADQSATAVVSNQAILIDGKEATNLSVYNIGGSDYFKLRDLGEALGFGVDYDQATNTAVVTSVPADAEKAADTEEATVDDKTTEAVDTPHV